MLEKLKQLCNKLFCEDSGSFSFFNEEEIGTEVKRILDCGGKMIEFGYVNFKNKIKLKKKKNMRP